MTIEDFCSLTLEEYQLKCKGFQMKEANDWNRTRNIMWSIFVSVSGKKGPKTPSEIMTIPMIDKDIKSSKRDLFKEHALLKAYLSQHGGTS